METTIADNSNEYDEVIYFGDCTDYGDGADYADNPVSPLPPSRPLSLYQQIIRDQRAHPELCADSGDSEEYPEFYFDPLSVPVPIRPGAESFRIIGTGAPVSNDTRKTGLNNNDLIIGPTGSGKTRSYIKPNLLQNALDASEGAPESLIITDTKGNLRHEVGPVLAAHGYEVLSIDFTDVSAGFFGYNPLDFVEGDPANGYNEQDILRIATAVCPSGLSDEPFWDNAARSLITAMISYTLESMPRYWHHLETVYDLVIDADSPRMHKALQQAKERNSNRLFAMKYGATVASSKADRMVASVIGIAAEHLGPLASPAIVALYKQLDRLDFTLLAQRPCALFLTVSDTDRSMDKLVNLLYSQAISELCRYADRECPDNRLPIPVRLYLDDFAASAVIPDFDKVTSVIRSRGLSVSIVLQSLTQLDTLYGRPAARTILNNCGHILYLGGHDLETVHYMAELSNCLPDRVLTVPVGSAFLYEDGAGGQWVGRYQLEDHPLYGQLPEAQAVDSREAA